MLHSSFSLNCDCYFLIIFFVAATIKSYKTVATATTALLNTLTKVSESLCKMVMFVVRVKTFVHNMFGILVFLDMCYC